MAAKRLRILFLCTRNSCRSQMAEGWARVLRAELIEAYSAGIESQALDPRAAAVMLEAGVDISRQKSKTIGELPVADFDFVITVCSDADRNCPVLPGKAQKIHRGFDDPPRLAMTARSEEVALGYYRRVRDEIRDFVVSLPASLRE